MGVMQRQDDEFVKALRECARVRVSKGLATLHPKDTSIREMQKLLQRTDGWKISLEELKSKPKRRE